MKIGELVDRATVARLYTERDNSGYNEYKRLKDGLFSSIVKRDKIPWNELIELMYQINGFIWDFEAPIHSGKLDCDPIMAGVLALRVRKLNAMRVNLSKLIDKLVE